MFLQEIQVLEWSSGGEDKRVEEIREEKREMDGGRELEAGRDTRQDEI